MKDTFPAVCSIICIIRFYARMVMRILIVRPAFILGTASLLFFFWFWLHPGDWVALEADNARSYQDAPVGQVLTEVCTPLQINPAGTFDRSAYQCTERAKPIGETAGETLAVMGLVIKVVLIFSVLIEVIQLLTGHHVIWPGSSVTKEGRGTVYHR